MNKPSSHDAALQLEHQARYRLLAENVNEMVSRHDAAGVYLDASPSCKNVFGYTQTELVGRNAYEFIHPDDIKDVQSIHGRLLSEDTVFTVEYRIHKKNGSVAWIETSTRTILDPLEGGVIEIICLSRDVSERKQAETALRESQQSFAAIFSNIQCGVALVNAQGQFIKVNRQMATMLGRQPEDLVKLNHEDIALHSDWKHNRSMFRRLQEGEIPSFRTEQRYHHRDGGIFWGDLSVTPIPASNGNGVAFVEMVVDISDRKRNEYELKWESSLNASLARLSKAMISQNVPIHTLAHRVLDEAKLLTGGEFGFVAEIDPVTRSLISYTLTEMMEDGSCELNDENQRIVFPIGPEGRYSSLWGHALNSRRPFYTNDATTHEDSQGLPDGHVEFKTFLAAPVLFGDELCGLIALAHRSRDFAPKHLEAAVRLAELYALALKQQREEKDRRRLEEQLRQTQKMESLGVLAEGVAHDFNNLLMVILGNTEMMMLSTETGSSEEESLQLIQSAALKGADLTKQMMAYSGGLALATQPIDFNHLVREITTIIEATVGNKIRVALSLHNDLPIIQGDKGKLRQAVMNLINNAAEAIGEETGNINIRTGVCELKPDDYIENFIEPYTPDAPGVFIEISDDGCGIEDDAFEKLFDPFYSTKFVGRGLGLAALMGIVKLHQGAIQLTSKPEHGAAFRLVFPVLNQTLL
ncbi:MAG: PAS domain S-box protein [Candidatus Hinthialibacter antarcticus]|nr:PAS domain S-box protein [Candidatus Hinthialibacter antarcticus]